MPSPGGKLVSNLCVRCVSPGAIATAAAGIAALLFGACAHAAASAVTIPTLVGIPVDFLLFGGILIGIALFHHHTLRIAVSGLTVITLYKIFITGFKTGPGMAGFVGHLEHEWVILTNLLGLLLGFALLSKHFEDSK